MNNTAVSRPLDRIEFSSAFVTVFMTLILLLTIGLSCTPAPVMMPDKSAASPVSSPPNPDSEGLAIAFGDLPLSFESAPDGSSTRFLARGAGYALALAPAEATFRLQIGGGAAPDAIAHDARLQLIGADPAATIVGLAQLPGVANYYIGSDPDRWRTDVPTFAKVKVVEAWPGIDVVYYGNAGRLETDFVVAPGADP